MRILFIQPGDGQRLVLRYLARVEPLGVESVAAGLRDHDVQLIDLRVENGLLSTLEQFRPELCGITCSFTVDCGRALEVARFVKAAGPGSPPFVLVGGHHASLNPGDFHDPAVDAVALGEGERTTADLAACLAARGNPRSVRGLALNVEGRQIRTGVRPLIENLDDLPPAARDLTRRYRHAYYMSADRPFALVETARGCPYRCIFCSVWCFYRGRYRAKSAARVVEELATVEEPFILFSDDNFLADPERARQIGQMLRERGLTRHYTIQARSDSIVAHHDVIALWREIGLESVFVGLEKIDERELASVNKANSVANNDQALRVLHDRGIGIVGSFIVDPEWERADFAALRDYVIARKIDAPSFTVLTPLPGTILYRRVRERLQTRDYELFDFLHAVLPTRLPLPEFYGELARLYRSTYSWRRIVREERLILRRALQRRSFSISHLRRLASAGRSVTNAESYLVGHRLGQAGLAGQ